MRNQNFPQSKEYELSLLSARDRDFGKIRRYLDLYIEIVLDRFDMSPETRTRLHRELSDDIPIAAKRYLASDSSKNDYKFSAYYSWYITEQLE